jgi:hypothetical protein
VFPDFIGIGAQKAGTTWLHRNLQAHPEIWMPKEKELHYFNKRINEPSGLSKMLGDTTEARHWRKRVQKRLHRQKERLSPREALWDLKYYLQTPNDEWYASLFKPGEDKTAGEITPAYSMLDRDMVSRVHGLMPNAKIIFFMRNPLERAWSQAVMHFNSLNGYEIEQVPADKLRRHFDRSGSRVRTDYLRTLANWGSLYPEDQIFVGFLEDIYFLPMDLLRSVFSFLSVDSSFEPPGVDQRIHSRSAGEVPLEHMVYLAHSYHDELTRLAERFGGYAKFWLYCAERLIDHPPAEEKILYPLWRSKIWDEWPERPRPSRLRSGSLPFVQSAAG